MCGSLDVWLGGAVHPAGSLAGGNLRRVALDGDFDKSAFKSAMPHSPSKILDAVSCATTEVCSSPLDVVLGSPY